MKLPVAALAVVALPLVVSAAEQPKVLTPLTVEGRTAGANTDGTLMEDVPDGVYGQPDWLGSRRFATTRAYIQQDPWEVGVEQWWRSRKNGGEWSHLFQEEVEIGLPFRFQLDAYYDWVLDEDKHSSYKDTAFELRWALADWGKIPLNPTLYFEYKLTDPDHGGDVIEPKILLSEDFGQGWHWAANFVWEKELTDEQGEEWAFTQAISKSLCDSKFSVGVEMTYKWETAIGSRAEPARQFNIGPSIQWRPTLNTHIDVVALAGLTHDSEDFEGWLVMGWDFGGEGPSHYEPVTRRQ